MTDLNAEMINMLEDLEKQLIDLHEDFFETEHFEEAYGVSDAIDIIEQKINDLKGVYYDRSEI